MNRGFTLVELLIVIAIMGILSSVTVGQFVTAKKKANDVARKSDLNGVSKALQMYFADYGKMPEVSAINWGEEFKDGDYVYMKVLPRENNINPNWPPYCYKTDGKKYALFAQLENTGDKDCTGKYDCGGLVGVYCFSFVSPNTSLKSDGSFN